MKTRATLEAIRAIPTSLKLTVTPEFLDLNGHMNVRHYFDIQERALSALMESYDLNEGYLHRTGNSTFTLEQHITYLDECLVGDELSVHINFVEFAPKVVHTVNYLVNDTRDSLSQILENVIGHIDLTARKLTPWPDEVRTQLEPLRDRRPAGTLPLSGCISLR